MGRIVFAVSLALALLSALLFGAIPSLRLWPLIPFFGGLVVANVAAGSHASAAMERMGQWELGAGAMLAVVSILLGVQGNYGFALSMFGGMFILISGAQVTQEAYNPHRFDC